jgi:hypothetical protein
VTLVDSLVADPVELAAWTDPEASAFADWKLVTVSDRDPIVEGAEASVFPEAEGTVVVEAATPVDFPVPPDVAPSGVGAVCCWLSRLSASAANMFESSAGSVSMSAESPGRTRRTT